MAQAGHGAVPMHSHATCRSPNVMGAAWLLHPQPCVCWGTWLWAPAQPPPRTGTPPHPSWGWSSPGLGSDAQTQQHPTHTQPLQAGWNTKNPTLGGGADSPQPSLPGGQPQISHLAPQKPSTNLCAGSRSLTPLSQFFLSREQDLFPVLKKITPKLPQDSRVSKNLPIFGALIFLGGYILHSASSPSTPHQPRLGSSITTG